MKLLCKIVLEEYGFIELPENIGPDVIMAKDNFNLTLKPDGACHYLNLGINYPVKDLAGLKKLYKEVKGMELSEIKLNLI
ncbi:MAG: hypothetical protein MUF75_02655 [Bacteroidia bacterium]|nr:hypothetical protein [Bacteroidia bacterium]